MVTFIDPKHVHHKRDFGRCYVKAGFRRCSGKTKAGLVVVHLAVSALPAPVSALPIYTEPICCIYGAPHPGDCVPVRRVKESAPAF